MDVRLIAGSLLLFLVTATAQETKPQGQVQPGQATPAPAPVQPPQAKPQDPDRPQPTPAQVAEDLNREKERLSREIAYAKDRAKNAKTELAAKLKPHADAHRAIDAGVMAVPTPPAMTQPPQPRSAHLGSKDEFADHNDDTMMLVNGRPVSRAHYDRLITFRKASATPGEAAQLAGAVLFELIQIEGVASAFDENEVRERVGELEMQLDGGKAIADMVKDVGVVPGCGPNGQFETTRNSMFGTVFAERAFAGEEGKRVRPFRNAHGIVVLKVDKVTKGATPDLDSVSGTALQVPYNNEPGALQKAQAAVHQAQIDIIVKDKEILELLPPMFRHDAGPVMMPVPTQGFDMTRLRSEMERITREMGELSGKTDDVSKAKLQALEARYSTMKRQMRAAEAGGEAPPPGGTDAVKGPPQTEQPKTEPPKPQPKEQSKEPPKAQPKQN